MYVGRAKWTGGGARACLSPYAACLVYVCCMKTVDIAGAVTRGSTDGTAVRSVLCALPARRCLFFGSLISECNKIHITSKNRTVKTGMSSRVHNGKLLLSLVSLPSLLSLITALAMLPVSTPPLPLPLLPFSVLPLWPSAPPLFPMPTAPY